MSSTITTGRAAAAVRSTDGQTIFLLFEETYCSNVSPKTPSWCCVGIGALSATLERIFDLASSCEGGMLRNRSGRLTPEGYIGTWLKELANPLVFHRTEIRFNVGEGLYNAISEAQLDEAVDLLAQAGMPGQANELHDAQRLTLDLARDTEAVLMLQERLKISPWRLVSAHSVNHRHGERSSELGYRPTSRKGSLPDAIMALKVNADVRLLRGPDDTWHCGGWQYAMVGQHVRDLWKTELACPGSHRTRIAAFRDALDRAAPAPPGLVVEIDSMGTTDAYYLQRIEELRQQVGGTGGVFQIAVTPQTEYALTNLPRTCARWLLPHDRRLPFFASQAVLAL